MKPIAGGRNVGHWWISFDERTMNLEQRWLSTKLRPTLSMGQILPMVWSPRRLPTIRRQRGHRKDWAKRGRRLQSRMKVQQNKFSDQSKSCWVWIMDLSFNDVYMVLAGRNQACELRGARIAPGRNYYFHLFFFSILRDASPFVTISSYPFLRVLAMLCL